MSKFLKSSSFVVLMNYLNVSFSFAKEMLLVSLLTPTQLGIWRIYITISGYFKYPFLGLPSILIYRGRKKGLVNKYTDWIFSLLILYGTFLSFSLCVGGYFFSDYHIGIVVSFSIVFFFLSFLNFIHSYYIAIGKLKLFSVFSFFQVSIFLFLLYVFSSSLASESFYIYALSLALSSVFSLFFCYKSFSFDIKKVFRSLKSLKKTFTMLLFSTKGSVAGFISYIYISMEVFLIQHTLGISILGYFSIVMIFYNLAMNFSSILVSLLMAYAKKFFLDDVFFSIKVLSLIFFFVALGSFFGYFIAYFLIESYFPKYLDVIDLLRIYIYCFPFLALQGYMLTIFISKNISFKYINCISFFLVVKFVFAYYIFPDKVILSLMIINIIYILTLIFIFFKGILSYEVSCSNAS